jgi:hypothetical protein
MREAIDAAKSFGEGADSIFNTVFYLFFILFFLERLHVIIFFWKSTRRKQGGKKGREEVEGERKLIVEILSGLIFRS